MLDTLYSYCNDWILFVNVSNTKYRLSAHLIMIEKGRFTQTPRERRLCNLCHINVEDEYHFILKCHFFINIGHCIIESIIGIYQACINWCN